MTHRQPFHQNLKTPIPYKTTESCGQKMESYVSKLTLTVYGIAYCLNK